MKIKEKEKRFEIVWPKECSIHKLNSKLFLEGMNILYGEKYKDFVSQYGEMNRVILPREYFYYAQNKDTKNWTSIFKSGKSN